MTIINGTSQADVLRGTRGDDTINALDGTDSIRISEGRDSIDGGDDIDGLALVRADTADFAAQTTAQSYRIDNNRLTDDRGAIDTRFGNIEQLSIDLRNSGSFNDQLDLSGFVRSGPYDPNIIMLGDGANTVFGTRYDDIIRLGTGLNVVDGVDGYDTVSIPINQLQFIRPLIDATGTALRIQRSDDQLLQQLTNVEEVIYGNVTQNVANHIDLVNFYLPGTKFVLVDTTFDDTLLGSVGNDVFRTDYRSVGNDVLTGNGGADLFDFATSAQAMANTTITDFDFDDVIDLAANDPRYGSFAIKVNRFIGTAAFSGVAGEYRYQTGSGKTLIQYDNDGDGVANGTLTIGNGEFELASTRDGMGEQNALRAVRRLDAPAATTGDDKLDGTAMADTISGLAGTDTITGGTGADLINGGDGADILYAGRFPIESRLYTLDRRYGPMLFDENAEVDTLNGGAGNDLLYAGVNDRVDGGDSNDTLFMSFGGAPGSVSLRFDPGFAWAGGRITAVESLAYIGGSAFDDRLDASQLTTGRVSIDGRDGNDLLIAGEATNSLFRGAGNDTLNGSRGNATLREMSGGRGDDLLIPNDDQSSIIDGGLGYDTVDFSSRGTGIRVDFSFSYNSAETRYRLANVEAVIGTGFDDYFNGNGGDNVMYGGAGNDTMIGGDGNDTLDGGAASDSMQGGNGDDLYYVGATDFDSVYEGPETTGYDAVITARDYSLNGRGLIEELRAASGTKAINLSGSPLADTLVGNDGDNVLNGNGSSDSPGRVDTMAGGRGNDSYLVRNAGDVVIEAAGAGRDTVFVAADYTRSYTLTTDAEVETLSMVANQAVSQMALTGNAFAQVIVGDYGNNLLASGGTSRSGDQNDVLIGLRGDDTYIVDSIRTAVFEVAGEGTDVVTVTIGGSNFVLNERTSVETIQAASGVDAINITGNPDAQTIIGNDGANILSGAGGGDTLIGLGGNDTYQVRSMSDQVIEANGGGSDVVFATVSYNLGANEVELLSTVVQAANDPIDLIGNYATQVIIGNYGNNVLNGESAGIDTLIGLFGDDTYAVGDARVIVVENAGQGNDTVVASVSYQLRTGVSVETLSAQNRSGTDALVLIGNETAQILAGNNGDNRIDGRGGADTLVGGGGADVFAFTTAAASGNADTILDFQAGVDRIGLATDVFAAVTEGGIQAGEIVAGTMAQDSDDRLLYDQASGRLFFDADANGAGAAVLIAQLTAGTALTAESFTAVAPVLDLAG